MHDAPAAAGCFENLGSLTTRQRAGHHATRPRLPS
jgi:hypothetical protein